MSTPKTSRPTSTPPPVGRRNGGVPLIRLVNAGKRYGAVNALSDVTMEVGAGEVTCVLGDNGAREVHPDQDYQRAAPAVLGHL